MPAWTNDPEDYCNACLPDGDPRYHDTEGCINGTVYGYCSADECYGLCDDLGSCNCRCHRG